MTLLSRCQIAKPLSELSTLGIGGPARYFLQVESLEEMQEAIGYCTQTALPYLIIGKGSNCLFDDRGFNGLVILNKIAFCNYDNTDVSVGAGYNFSLLGVQTARRNLAGLEFASGIPATVGGAIYMNAGANGSETCETLQEVTYITEKAEVVVLSKDKLTFAYRFSSFQNMKGAIVSAQFALKNCDLARNKQLQIIDYRKKTQPYGDLSAGSVFRNPLPFTAGALIDGCGLKGKKVGGAEVSLLHANFIVNRERATAKDFLTLARLIQQEVKEKKEIELEMEVRYIPYEPT